MNPLLYSLGMPPSHSDYQDYCIFSTGSQAKLPFATVTGRGLTSRHIALSFKQVSLNWGSNSSNVRSFWWISLTVVHDSGLVSYSDPSPKIKFKLLMFVFCTQHIPLKNHPIFLQKKIVANKRGATSSYRTTSRNSFPPTPFDSCRAQSLHHCRIDQIPWNPYRRISGESPDVSMDFFGKNTCGFCLWLSCLNVWTYMLPSEKYGFKTKGDEHLDLLLLFIAQLLDSFL